MALESSFDGLRRGSTRLVLAVGLLGCAVASAQADEIPTLNSGQVERWRVEWPNTKFQEHEVKLEEIVDGGPPKDGIPAITGPGFFYAKDVAVFSSREPVVALEVNGEARAYPVRYLMWHEIVNDKIQNIPVAITFCPLCNTAMVFDRRIGEQTRLFGVSGKLRNSNLLMYDRKDPYAGDGAEGPESKAQSWWQQFTGEAIVGVKSGQRLKTLPAALMSWGAYRAAYPEGLVMAQPKNYGSRYGDNPYVGYDDRGWPLFYKGEEPPHGVPPLARVVQVGDKAWPLTRLAKEGEITEAGVRLTWRAGQASALDRDRIADGREVGDVRAYDAKTGDPIAHSVPYAFAFNAFYPSGQWMMGN